MREQDHNFGLTGIKITQIFSEDLDRDPQVLVAVTFCSPSFL